MGMNEEEFALALSHALANENIKNSILFQVNEDLKGEFVAIKNEIKELVKTIKQKDVKIERLEKRVKAQDQHIKSLQTRQTQLENDFDAHEQYSRRNSLKVAGVPETQYEDPEALVMSLFNETMGMGPSDEVIKPDDLDRVHRVGKSKPGKTRQIIVKFATYRARRRVYSAKRRLVPMHQDWSSPPLSELAAASDAASGDAAAGDALAAGSVAGNTGTGDAIDDDVVKGGIIVEIN